MTGDGEPSGGRKFAATVVGFILFYATILMLATVVVGVRVFGGVVGAVAVVGAVVWVVRTLRHGTVRQRSLVRWGAVGFAAAMVVFGGCLGLIATGKIRIAG